MPLHRLGARERALLMGGMGSGKTKAYFDLAAWCRRTQAPSRFYVMDTDRSFIRSSEEWGGVEACMTNMVVFPEIQWVDGVPTQKEMAWEDYKMGMNTAKAWGTVHDVLVIDMANWPWNYAQKWYTNKMFHKDLSSYFLEARKSMQQQGKEGLGAFHAAYGADWQVINAEYRDTVDVLINFPGHVIGCTGMTAVNRANDDDDLIKVFGRFGMKPEGQKDLGHHFHTVLAMEQIPGAMGGTMWTMTTVKDRGGRAMMVKQPVTRDWVLDYLIPVAGWKLA